MRYITLLLILLFVAGCNQNTSESGNKDERFEILSSNSLPWLLIDNETGCQYISNGSNTPYTLLYNSNGEPYCPK